MVKFTLIKASKTFIIVFMLTYIFNITMGYFKEGFLSPEGTLLFSVIGGLSAASAVIWYTIVLKILVKL